MISRKFNLEEANVNWDSLPENIRIPENINDLEAYNSVAKAFYGDLAIKRNRVMTVDDKIFTLYPTDSIGTLNRASEDSTELVEVINTLKRNVRDLEIYIKGIRRDLNEISFALYRHIGSKYKDRGFRYFDMFETKIDPKFKGKRIVCKLMDIILNDQEKIYGLDKVETMPVDQDKECYPEDLDSKNPPNREWTI